MALCKLAGASPSLLLHPLDFLSGDDEPELAFFPAMRMGSVEKISFVREVLADFARRYDVLTVGQHAAALASHQNLPVFHLPGPAITNHKGGEAAACFQTPASPPLPALRPPG